MMGAMASRGGYEQSHPTGVSASGWVSVGSDSGPTVAMDPVADLAGKEVLLPSHPESAGKARRLAVEVLRTWNLGGQIVETGELLVSELVGNAVRHAGARTFGLRITR